MKVLLTDSGVSIMTWEPKYDRFFHSQITWNCDEQPWPSLWAAHNGNVHIALQIPEQELSNDSTIPLIPEYFACKSFFDKILQRAASEASAITAVYW